jgi:hypothetical protein
MRSWRVGAGRAFEELWSMEKILPWQYAGLWRSERSFTAPESAV